MCFYRSSYVFRDGSHTLTGDHNGGLCTWNVISQRIVDQFYNEDAHKPISCISVSSMSDRDDEGRYLAVNSYDNVLRVYDRGSFGTSTRPQLLHCLTGHQNRNWPIQSSFFHGHLRTSMPRCSGWGRSFGVVAYPRPVVLDDC